jgi:regulatory protein YycI of two-component signal transduction system YycFG
MRITIYLRQTLFMMLYMMTNIFLVLSLFQLRKINDCHLISLFNDKKYVKATLNSNNNIHFSSITPHELSYFIMRYEQRILKTNIP